MEFGIFNSVYVPKSMWEPDMRAGERRRILDEIEFVRAADRSGFKYTWATEHHFLEEYSHLSSNQAFMGYLAGVTERIHIGSGIINITPPVSHPARVAEAVAMLDHLSDGRFEFGFGRGSSTTEQRGFGIEDPEITKDMVDETLPQIVRMWKESKYSYDGQFFSMPERNVLPKPFTDPHPPIWVAAGNPSTFEKAARMGLGVLCFSMLGPDAVAPMIEKYKTLIEDAEPVGGYVNNNVMVTSTMLCLEDGKRAREAALAMNQHYHGSLLFKYLDTFPKPPGIPDWPEILPALTPDILEAGIADGSTTVGDPDECERSVQRFVDAGADQLVFGMLSSDMPIDVCVESVETFGKHVLPRFDKDPEFSTAKQRAAQLA
jgi:alkanesulfonate monooxygenase SsuD/methylene tetrahydromethanopterin reductase-like flavin-dependent oxidoreductase (luciferase family)